MKIKIKVKINGYKCMCDTEYIHTALRIHMVMMFTNNNNFEQYYLHAENYDNSSNNKNNNELTELQ